MSDAYRVAYAPEALDDLETVLYGDGDVAGKESIEVAGEQAGGAAE